MSSSFNPADAQTYFSAKFWKDHVYVGTEMQKKKAEAVFLRRSVSISTVLCLTRAELIRLAGEIHQRQSEYAKHPPRSLFRSRQEYDFWSRGGSRPRDRQAASSDRKAFRYAVVSGPDDRFVMHHFDG
ncbi:MAG: hypothetical protein AAGA03_00120 [Planctomycetota bacterium]